MRMNNYLKPSNPVAIPIFPFVAGEHFTSWLNKQTPERQNWLQAMQFNAKPGSFLVVPNKQGAIESVLLGLSNANDFWALGALPAKLPIADYRIDDVLAIFNREDLWRAHLAWALGSYRFDLYKKTKIELPSLAIDKSCDLKDLELWQVSMNFVVEVYTLTKLFPKEEQFGLTIQLRRAAVSFTSNIAEGFTRKSSKEKYRFYNNAKASLTEIQNQLLIARDVGYLSRESFNKIAQQSVITNRLISGLLKSTRQKKYES